MVRGEVQRTAERSMGEMCVRPVSGWRRSESGGVRQAGGVPWPLSVPLLGANRRGWGRMEREGGPGVVQKEV